MRQAAQATVHRIMSPPKGEAGGCAAAVTHPWRVGHAVEVAGTQEEGYGDAFYKGVLLSEPDERGYLQVLLPDFGEEELERVHVTRLRPPPPPSLAQQRQGSEAGWRAAYPVGTPVEVCCEELGRGLWWRGAVSRATGGDGLVVTLVTGDTQDVGNASCLRRALLWNEAHNSWAPDEAGRDGAGAGHTPLTAATGPVPEPATTSREASDERQPGDEDDEDVEDGDEEDDGEGDESEEEAPPRRSAAGRAQRLLSSPRARTRGGLPKPGGVDTAEGLLTETGRPRRAAATAVFYGSPVAPAREPRVPHGDRPRRTTRAAAGGGRAQQGGDDDAWVRRSERARSSRLVTVGGVPVLRSNLRETDVVDDQVGGVNADWMVEEEDDRDGAAEEEEEEEGSDADEEADGESDEENLVEEGGRGAGGKRRRASGSPAARRGGVSKKRAVSGPEARRLAHNREVDATIAELAPVQESYLAQHVELLRPWLEPKVLARLEKADKALCPPVSEYVVPQQVTAVLRAHQVAGFQYLVNAFERGLHPILGDEMGLGKTLQTVTLLAHATFGSATRSGPHLVVCPLSVLQTWQTELHRWCPALRVVRCHSSDVSERARLRDGPLRDPGAFDVALTTYEMLSSDLGDTLRRCMHWGCLVLDEGHRLKNEASQAAGAVGNLHRRCTVLLTGTLLQNNMHELWALLHVCYPRVFTDSAPFDAAFDLKTSRQVIDAAALTQARAMLRPLWLRREKADVELNLPPKTETLVHCPLSAAQTALYRSALLSNAAILDASVPEVAAGGDGPEEAQAAAKPSQADVRKMNHLCMQLRLLCGHPLLCTDEKDFGLLGLDEEDAAVEALIAASGKLSVLDRLLQRLLRAGHRVVIFTQFSMVLDILEEYCTKRSLPFARLDGTVCRARRQIDIMLFNRKDSPLKVFLASTRAGGLGINLQSADTCILYDSDWNPQADAQAMARVHRIGQTKPVAVFRLVTANTVEERIVTRANKKLYMDAIVARTSVPGGEDDDGDGERAAGDEDDAAGGDSDSEAHQAGAPRDRHTLAADLRFGADALFKSAQGKEPSDEELDALCDRSPGGEARRAALACMQQTGTVSAEALAEVPLPLTSYLGPEGAEMRRSALEAARQAQEDAKRTVGERVRTTVTVQIDGFAVKRSNLYGLEEGEPSVWDVEAAGKGGKSGRPAALPKRKVLVAGRDYGHSAYCQVCWEGGDLFCCNYCPAVYHAKCVGISAKALERAHAWSCPHHQCSECDRKSAACGGLLFRCESCATAYCEDHLPEEVMEHGRIVDLCERWVRLGMTHQPGACFIHCSQDCEEFAASGFDGALEDNGEEVLPPWVQPGDAEVIVPTVAGAPGGMPLRGISFSALKRYIHSVYAPTQPMPGAPPDLADVELRDYANDDETYGAIYVAARDAIARDAPNRAAPPPPRTAAPGQAGGAGDGNAQKAKRAVNRWTPPEEALLHVLAAAHSTEGHGKWSTIFAAGAGTWHPGRTPQHLQVKWYQICAKKRREAGEAQLGAGGAAEGAADDAEMADAEEEVAGPAGMAV